MTHNLWHFNVGLSENWKRKVVGRELLSEQRQRQPDASSGTELVSSSEGEGGADTSQACLPAFIISIACDAGDDDGDD